MADHLVFVIASSGVIAEKTGNAMVDYNDASEHARRIASHLGCKNLRQVFDLYGSLSCIAETLKQSVTSTQSDYSLQEWVKDMIRVKQFIEESDVIGEGMARALSSSTDQHNKIKELSFFSHSLGDEALGNLVEATAWLPKRAMHLKALGSSSFGAGFGGSVYAVVNSNEADSFEKQWSDDYKKAFPQYAKNSVFFTMRPGPSACRL